MIQSLKLRSSLLLAATMWLLTLPAESQAETSTGIIINEIMVSNVGDVISPSFNFDGWVELYNPTSKAISLEGYTVSDGVSVSWQLPASIGSIPAKGFKVIAFGSNEIRSDQAPFKLDCDGGTISLSDKSGKTVTTPL